MFLTPLQLMSYLSQHSHSQTVLKFSSASLPLAPLPTCYYNSVQWLGAEPRLEFWCHWFLYNSVKANHLTSLYLSFLTNKMGMIHTTSQTVVRSVNII